MTTVLINPGSGPVHEAGNTRRQARRNIGAFCRDVGLTDPAIRILGKGDRETGERDDGRYSFVLKRGLEEIDVLMPGIALERVRFMDLPGQNIWHFPRIYVDGNSWIWSIGVDVVHRALLDHDHSARRGYEASVRDCDFVMQHEPRCPTCNAIKDRYHTDYDTENVPHGYNRLRCVVCTPVMRTTVEKYDGSTFTEKKPTHNHGTIYRVTRQLLPHAALGEIADGPDAGKTVVYDCTRWRASVSHVTPCRLERGHAGKCEPRWKEIKRESFAYPYDGIDDEHVDTGILIEEAL